jgi:hypothetical protein
MEIPMNPFAQQMLDARRAHDWMTRHHEPGTPLTEAQKKELDEYLHGDEAREIARKGDAVANDPISEFMAMEVGPGVILSAIPGIGQAKWLAALGKWVIRPGWIGLTALKAARNAARRNVEHEEQQGRFFLTDLVELQDKGGMSGNVIQEGSDTAFLDGQPIAYAGAPTTQPGTIVTGATNTFVGVNGKVLNVATIKSEHDQGGTPVNASKTGYAGGGESKESFSRWFYNHTGWVDPVHGWWTKGFIVSTLGAGGLNWLPLGLAGTCAFHFGGGVVTQAIGSAGGMLDTPETYGQVRGLAEDLSPIITSLAIKETKDAVRAVTDVFDGVTPKDAANYFRRTEEIKPLKGELWGPDGPKPTDFSQGQLGDCWLIGNLIAHVKQDPKSVGDMVRNNPDGTYTVTWSQTCRSCGPKETTVNSSVPFYRGTNTPVYARTPNGVIGPAILEKAAAKEFGDGKGYDGLRGSTMDTDNYIEANQRSLGSDGDDVQYYSTRADLFGYMKDRFDQGAKMSASTPLGFSWFRITEVGRQFFYAHRYAITGLSEENGEQTITLFNPHNSGGAYGSEFTMPYTTFMRVFDGKLGGSFSTASPPPPGCRSCHSSTPYASAVLRQETSELSDPALPPER